MFIILNYVGIIIVSVICSIDFSLLRTVYQLTPGLLIIISHKKSIISL